LRTPITAILAVLLSVAAAAQQSGRARTEQLARRASDRLTALYQEADRLANEARSLIGDLRKLEIERQIRIEEVRQNENELRAVESELAGLDRQIEKLEAEDLESQPELRARLVEMYKYGQGRYLRLLLSTADVRQLGRASRLVAAMSKLDEDRVAAHQRRVAALKTTREQLDARRRQVAALRTKAERAGLDADRALRARDALLKDIDARRDLNAQLTGELQSAQQKLQLTLRDVAAGGSAAELPVRPFRGDLDWPVTGSIRQRFGALSPRGIRFNGLEIAAEEGTPARAMHGGSVAYADRFTGLGYLVILDHGAQVFTLYGNLLEVSVKAGATVERGQTVGSVGTSTTGAAGLYFELRVDGKPVDPLQWLRKL
jgi:septal ring factor EnvC (AmiA/AmiB activator)